MLPDGADHSPLSITARITVVLNRLRVARAECNPTIELAWLGKLDRLLDIHIQLLRASGKFRPLEELDPELAERLTPPRPSIRYIARERRGREHP